MTVSVREAGVGALLATWNITLIALGGRALLDHGRGRTPPNVPRLAEIIGGVLAAAASLGPRPHSIKINPLLVNGDEVTLLDAIVVVRDTYDANSDCVQRILRDQVTVHYSGDMPTGL